MSAVPVINKLIINDVSAEIIAASSAFFSVLFFGVFESARMKTFIKPIFNRMIIVSGFYNTLALILALLALTRLHPAVIGFIGRLGIVFAMLLSSFKLRKNPTLVEVFLAVVAIAGAFSSAVSDIDDFDWLGVLFAAVSTFSFAYSNLNLRNLNLKIGNNLVLISVNMVSLLLLCICCLFQFRELKMPSAKLTWELIILGSLIGNCLGCWMYLESMKHLSFARANILRAIGPIFTLLFSLPFFGSMFNPQQIESALVLLASVLLLSFYENRKKAVS